MPRVIFSSTIIFVSFLILIASILLLPLNVFAEAPVEITIEQSIKAEPVDPDAAITWAEERTTIIVEFLQGLLGEHTLIMMVAVVAILFVIGLFVGKIMKFAFCMLLGVVVVWVGIHHGELVLAWIKTFLSIEPA